MTPLTRDGTATELNLSLPQSPTLNSDNELYSTKSVDLSAGVVPTPADATLSLSFEIVDGGTGTGTITDDGVLTGGDPGTVNVKVTDQNSGLSTELTVTVCEYTAPSEFVLRDSDPLITAANCDRDVIRVMLYEPGPGVDPYLVNVKPKITVTGEGYEDVETEVVPAFGVESEDQFYYFMDIRALSSAEGPFTIKVEDEITGNYVERTVVFTETFATDVYFGEASVSVAASGEIPLDVKTTPEYCETELSFAVSDSLGTVAERYNGLHKYYVFVAGDTAGSGTITVTDQLSSDTATCSVTVTSD